jgi:Helix-turn-helix domain
MGGESQSQLFLFESEATAAKDGSFVVRPRRLCTGQEVGVQRVCGLLGFKDRESIYRLIDLGEIKAWKPDSARGNGKWRIDLQSVLEYKQRRANYR